MGRAEEPREVSRRYWAVHRELLRRARQQARHQTAQAETAQPEEEAETAERLADRFLEAGRL